MKSCSWCGMVNDDEAASCRGCGTSSFKIERPVEACKVDHPAPFPKFESRQLTEEERKEAFAVLHKCLVAEEANIIVGRLVAAGIDASITNEASTQAFGGGVNTRDHFRVIVPTDEFDAACELLAADMEAGIEAMQIGAEAVLGKADLPLDTSMKCLMFVLPFGCLSLFIGPFITRHYTQNGYTRRAADGGRAFLCGTLSAIVVYLILFLARLAQR